jgi:hypothetical protein
MGMTSAMQAMQAIPHLRFSPQALFDLKSHVDLLPRLEKEVELSLKAYDDIVEDWKKRRDISTPGRYPATTSVVMVRCWLKSMEMSPRRR